MDNNNLPLVTIIIASYNHGRYIRQCLESIKSQSYKNIEILMTDDASKDETRKLFKLYSADFPGKKNFIFNDKNVGLANTLNNVMPMVGGKYVKIIAADDYLHPDSIEKCVTALEKAGDGFGMAFTDFFTVNDDSEIMEPHINYDQMPEIFDNDTLKNVSLLTRNRIIAPSTLLRTDIWKNTGPYNPALIMEDYDRWFRMSKVKKILFLPEKLCYYRRHPSNLSQSGHIGMSLDDIYLKIANDENGLVKNLINKRMAGLYISKSSLSENLIQAYSKYPYRTKILSFLLKNNIPPHLYQLFFRLRYGNYKK